MKFSTLILLLCSLSFYGCSTTTDEDQNTTQESSVDDVAVDVVTEDNTTTTITTDTIEVSESVSVVFVDGVTSKELHTNSEATTVELLVFGPNNTPYSDGEIAIVYPQKALTGVDIGTFSSLSVSIENGRALFNYVGPSNLQALVDNNDTNTTFGFYHSSSTTNVNYFTFTYAPQENQSVIEYHNIVSSLDDANLSMGLESNKIVSFSIQNENGSKVLDEDIYTIDVEVLNTPLLELSDTLGSSGDALSYTSQNDISLNFETNTISGLVPIKVSTNFKDANDENVSLEKVFNIVVLSGPPTAISISYAGTSIDTDRAKFQEHLVVSVTDKYFNPVNTNPAISVGVLAGYAKDLNGTRIYYEPDSNITATLDVGTHIFSATGGIDFSGVDENNYVLTTFSKGYTYDSAGKWDFTLNGVTNTNELMILDDIDSNTTRSNLGFAIGNNYREEVCQPWIEWLGYIRTLDTSTTLDTLGNAQITLDYDYYLMGKDVVVWVNIVGYNTQSMIEGKIGEAKKITLRGNGFDETYSIASVDSGASNQVYRIFIMQSTTKEWYKNGRFAYDVEVSDNLSINSISDSNADITSCESGGVAFVDVNVSENDGVSGTISIKNIVISNEF